MCRFFHSHSGTITGFFRPKFHDLIHPVRRLKYCTARSCFSAAARESNVPKLRRLPVRGLRLRDESRYFPDFSFLIIVVLRPELGR